MVVLDHSEVWLVPSHRQVLQQRVGYHQCCCYFPHLDFVAYVKDAMKLKEGCESHSSHSQSHSAVEARLVGLLVCALVQELEQFLFSYQEVEGEFLGEEEVAHVP
jgi:hypothetical protein